MSAMPIRMFETHPDNDVELNNQEDEGRPSAVPIILDCRADNSGHELQCTYKTVNT